MPSRLMLPAGRHLARAVPLVVAAGAATVLVATALTQHPNRAFDRLRDLDRFGLVLPNWRFFAPIPAMDDYRVLHRVQYADGSESDWVETIDIADRSLLQLVWFPDRRREKAVFDITSELLAKMPQGDDAVLGSAAYRTLSGVVRAAVETEIEAGRYTGLHIGQQTGQHSGQQAGTEVDGGTAGAAAAPMGSLEPPLGFQFLIARHAGFDEVPEPEFMLISPFVPWRTEAA